MTCDTIHAPMAHPTAPELAVMPEDIRDAYRVIVNWMSSVYNTKAKCSACGEEITQHTYTGVAGPHLVDGKYRMAFGFTGLGGDTYIGVSTAKVEPAPEESRLRDDKAAS